MNADLHGASETPHDDEIGARKSESMTDESGRDAGGQENGAGEPDLPVPQIAPSALRAATEAPPELPAVADDEPQADAHGVVLDTDCDLGLDLGLAPGVAAPEPAEAPSDGSGDGAEVTDELDQPDGLDEDGLAWRALPLTTRLEALLFAATSPLSLRRLQTLAGDVDAVEVRDGLASLAAHYEATSRSFGLDEIGGGYQLRTRAELSGLLARLGRRRAAERLTPAAVETLAIVAYRQPVLRVDVEKIRGVASGDVLRTLVEKGVVRVAGRADLPGAPLLYGTTPAFLELFGLRDLRDLPTDRELLRAP